MRRNDGQVHRARQVRPESLPRALFGNRQLVSGVWETDGVRVWENRLSVAGMKKLRVLIACEFSGAVRRAFRELGHDAWSCDLLPAEDGKGNHIMGDARLAIEPGATRYAAIGCANWDLLIAHPPCTYLCNSGVRWLAPGGKLDPARHKLMIEACDFFAQLYWANVPHIAIENPIMHKYARDYLQSAWKVPSYSFSIQPYEHGEPETKRTCFWLGGTAKYRLPSLVPSAVVNGRNPRVHHANPGPDRWKERSRTLPGVAQAIAQQWSSVLSGPSADFTP